jgi:putative transposase
MRYGYSTDLTDNEWSVIQRYFPRAKKQGRPPRHAKRIIVNAILYILRAGCAWRLLPNDFPPHKTVYHCFWLWRKQGLWERIHDKLRQRTRIKGRRRHILVDVLGLIIAVSVTAASIQERSEAKKMLGGIRGTLY